MNYGATYGFIDSKVTQKLFEQLNSDPYNNDLLQQYNEMMMKQDQLMQQRIQFRYEDFTNGRKTKMSGTIRVSGELAKPSNMDDMSAQSDKKYMFRWIRHVLCRMSLDYSRLTARRSNVSIPHW